MTTAVLIPDTLGALHLYVRHRPGPLRLAQVIAHAADLDSALYALPHPLTLILCGARNLDEVASVALGHGDFYLVGIRWLSSIPRELIYARAALAAKLVTAHRARPIERIRHSRRLECPF